MRRLLVIMVMFGMCALSYGAPNSGHFVLVYQGSISAERTIFDVNDTNLLESDFLKVYWAVDVFDTADAKNGLVFDSNSVIYRPIDNQYKVIPDSIHNNPHDPCKVELFEYLLVDSFGRADTFVVGKGSPIRIFQPNWNDSNSLVKKYAPFCLKGAGLLSNYDFLDPNDITSGTVQVTLTLNLTLTQKANTDGNNVDGVINSIVYRLTLPEPNGCGWHRWSDCSRDAPSFNWRDGWRDVPSFNWRDGWRDEQ